MAISFHDSPPCALCWPMDMKREITIGIIGVLCHRLYFIRGEHHLKAPIYLLLWLFTTISGTLLIHFTQPYQPDDCFWQPIILSCYTLFVLQCAFFGPLYVSIAIYRIFEHPLREFDGPRLAAMSKFWHFFYMFKTQNHLLLDSLHRKYGSFVRIGPQEILIVDPDVWHAIAGSGTTCIKAPWYDMLWPYVSLNSLRTKEGYVPRRKRWDEAMRASYKDMLGKTSCVHHYAVLLLRGISASNGRPLNTKTWFHHFSFDVMGHLAFGKPFFLTENLTTEDIQPHHAPSLMSEGMSMLRFFTPIPWIGHICLNIAPYFPIITQKWNRAIAWAAEICDERLEKAATWSHSHVSVTEIDAFSRFISSARSDNDILSLDKLALYGDAFAITVAGSHSVASTLTMLCYELASRPGVQEELRREITTARAIAAKEDHAVLKESVNMEALENIPLMDACINETLRLYPVIPTGGVRQTVQSGIYVGGRWIPPHTVIVAPRWSIGRLEAAFERPNEFIPYRWTTDPWMVKDKQAANAFGSGRHSCPGKQLGIVEVRTVMALLVFNFHFSIPLKQTHKSRAVDDIQDNFTLVPENSDLVFTPSRDRNVPV